MRATKGLQSAVTGPMESDFGLQIATISPLPSNPLYVICPAGGCAEKDYRQSIGW